MVEVSTFENYIQFHVEQIIVVRGNEEKKQFVTQAKRVKPKGEKKIHPDQDPFFCGAKNQRKMKKLQEKRWFEKGQDFREHDRVTK